MAWKTREETANFGLGLRTRPLGRCILTVTAPKNYPTVRKTLAG